MSTIKDALSEADRLAQAVTVHQPFLIGVHGVFAVQAGVPMAAAFDDLSLLVSTARDAAADLAQLLGDSNPPSSNGGASLIWPIMYLLDMANALQSSMSLGLTAARRDGE